MSSGDNVWLIEDSVIGVVLKHGSHFSLVSWFKDGISYEEYLENFEFIEYEIIDGENEEN